MREGSRPVRAASPRPSPRGPPHSSSRRAGGLAPLTYTEDFAALAANYPTPSDPSSEDVAGGGALQPESVTAGKSAEWLADRHPPWCVKVVLDPPAVGDTTIKLRGTSDTGAVVCTPASAGIGVPIGALVPSTAPGSECALLARDGATETELALIRCRSPNDGICSMLKLQAYQSHEPGSATAAVVWYPQSIWPSTASRSVGS